MMQFEVDQTFEDGLAGVLWLTLTAAETVDRDGDLIPFNEQEAYLDRLAEVIQKGYDPFDLDHETNEPITLQRNGDGALGRYIMTRIYTTLENGVPIGKVALKLLDKKGRDLAKNIKGTSLAALADALTMEN